MPEVVAVNPAKAHPQSGVHQRVNDPIGIARARVKIIGAAGWEIAGDLYPGRRTYIYEGPTS